MDEPTLSVVVPTLERGEALARLLPTVVPQLSETAELWVIDQSSKAVFAANGTLIAAFADRRLRHLRRMQRGLPAARNAGVEASAGDLVLFLDDDVTVRPGCIDAHVAAYADPTVGGVVGRIVERSLQPNAAPGTNRVGRGGRIRTHLDATSPGPVRTLKGANMSLRRTALEQAGPFDAAYGGTALLEDADLSTRVHRLGWSLSFEPRAAVDHHYAPLGGVRQADDRATEGWRFHNTGYFMRRHRGRRSAPTAALTFGAIAVRRAIEWRDPAALSELLGEWMAGWRLAAEVTHIG